MSDPTPEAYEAAGRAYCLTRFDYHRAAYVSDQARLDHIAVDASSTTEEPWLRVVVDAVWKIAEATVRAKVAAEIRSRPPISFPVVMRCVPYWNSLSGPYGNGYLEWCARIAEGNGDKTKTSSAGPSGG